MPPISAGTEVNRSAEEVFAYATDPARFSEWQQGVVDGHLDGPRTPAVGATCVTIPSEPRSTSSSSPSPTPDLG